MAWHKEKKDASFLKKRSKRLLIHWPLSKLSRHGNKSLFASFSSEKEDSSLASHLKVSYR